jgi:hypothetical protein
MESSCHSITVYATDSLAKEMFFNNLYSMMITMGVIWVLRTSVMYAGYFVKLAPESYLIKDKKYYDFKKGGEGCTEGG